MRTKKHELDKFYTKPEVVDVCLAYLDLKKYATIIDPAAGNGAFSNKIKNCIAMDVEPDGDGIIRQDFLDYEPEPLKEPVLCISNVPFGVQSNLAIKFFNKAAAFSTTIAFILPKSFKKESIQKRLNHFFHMRDSIDLPEYSFYLGEEEYNVPCVFQIWEREAGARKSPPSVEPSNFTFIKKSLANVAIRRVGYYAGTAFEEVEGRSCSSHYFIKYDGDVRAFINKVNSIEWEHDNTVGPRSISKKELIKAIDKVFNT